MEDLIIHSAMLFDGRDLPLPGNSHPLPPEPLGEEPLPSTYGSAYTQVASVPPMSPRQHHAKTESQGSSRHHDFAPQLPPRPGNSIHPSRRVQNQSSNSHSGSNKSGSETDDEQRQPTSPVLPPRPPGAAAPAIGAIPSEATTSDTNTIMDASGFTQERRDTFASGASAGGDSEASPTSAQFASARSSPGTHSPVLASPTNMTLPAIPHGGLQMSTEELSGIPPATAPQPPASPKTTADP